MGLMGHICPVMRCTARLFVSFDLSPSHMSHMSYLSYQSYSRAHYAQVARVPHTFPISSFISHHSSFAQRQRDYRPRAAHLPPFHHSSFIIHHSRSVSATTARVPHTFPYFIIHHSSFIIRAAARVPHTFPYFIILHSSFAQRQRDYRPRAAHLPQFHLSSFISHHSSV